MGNVNKPLAIELIERSIWRAIIKIAIGLDAETAVLEVVDTWDSPEMNLALTRDDHARMWFKNLRGKVIIFLSLYVHY